MFKSFSLLFDDSNPWNPHCVRNFLNIPEDQINLLSNIAEWSVRDSESANIAAEDLCTLKDSEKKLPKKVYQKEKNLLIFDKNIDIRREVLAAFVFNKKKPLLTNSFSLCNIAELYSSSENNCELKHSSSVPSILHVSSEIPLMLNNLKSRFCKIANVLSLEYSKLNVLLPESSFSNSNEKISLNKTFTISSVFNLNSKCVDSKKPYIQKELDTQNLHIISQNTVITDNKMSNIDIKQVCSDVSNHDNLSSGKGSAPDGNVIDTSDVLASHEISKGPELYNHTKSSQMLFENNLSQKENIVILNECDLEKKQLQKNSQNVLEDTNYKTNFSQVHSNAVTEEHILHNSQNSLELNTCSEKQKDVTCVHNTSKTYFEETLCSQVIPCGQQQANSLNTTTTNLLAEDDDDDVEEVPSKLDFQLPNEAQSSNSLIKNVPQQVSVTVTEKENHSSAVCVNVSGKNIEKPVFEKEQKSNQKKRKSYGKKEKGMPSVKCARKADEISFSATQLEKMLSLMKMYVDTV